MAQHDYNIANNPGAAVRADINALAEAIITNNSGTSAPTVTFPFMFWMDTFANILKVRNSANNAWINFLTISGSTISLSSGALPALASGDWFGTNVRYPTVSTTGVMEIGSTIDFHPDAAGTEDYRVRISRATGANGALTITNTGSGGINLVPGSGGVSVDGTAIAVVPYGLVAPFAGTTAPTGWLMCYGQNVNRITYADLFATIGTTYGVGDGSTTFTLPDLRGRVVAGQDDMGGTSANRLTGISGSVNGDNLGAAGGAEGVALTEANLAPHDHSVDPPSTATDTEPDHGHPARYSGQDNASVDPTGGILLGANSELANFTHTGTPDSDRGDQIGGGGEHAHTVNIASFNSGSAGSGTAHNNVQPTLILNYIIFAGA